MKNIIFMFSLLWILLLLQHPFYLPSLYRRKRWLTNVPQTTKIPNCGRSWGFWVRYKGLPECLSICELCVYCSCCTNTLSHLRLSQGMSQTAGNQNLIPAVLDGSLCNAYGSLCPLFNLAEGNKKSERFPDEEKVRIILVWWTI